MIHTGISTKNMMILDRTKDYSMPLLHYSGMDEKQLHFVDCSKIVRKFYIKVTVASQCTSPLGNNHVVIHKSVDHTPEVVGIDH